MVWDHLGKLSARRRWPSNHVGCHGRSSVISDTLSFRSLHNRPSLSLEPPGKQNHSLEAQNYGNQSLPGYAHWRYGHSIDQPPGSDHHFYFTNPGWFDNGSKLLFGSDRHNRSNLYGCDLATGAIEQLTDLEPVPLPREVEFVRSCRNPVREEAYFGTTAI